MPELLLPDILSITAQAGAGKDTTTRILHALCIRSGKRVLSFGSGDLLRLYAERKTPLGEAVKVLLSRGERVPLPIVSELVEDYIFENIGKYDHLLLNGSPRFVAHCDTLYEYMRRGYFQSVKILEVIAPDAVCAPRLFHRTEQDKREDLSMDGKRGTPDPVKIDRKMSWWNSEAEAIRRRAQELGMYLEVRNDQDLACFEKRLCELFTQKAIS
jgi:adenylate kinase family enzyme